LNFFPSRLFLLSSDISIFFLTEELIILFRDCHCLVRFFSSHVLTLVHMNDSLKLLSLYSLRFKI
jgi:hypothetical protein